MKSDGPGPGDYKLPSSIKQVVQHTKIVRTGDDDEPYVKIAVPLFGTGHTDEAKEMSKITNQLPGPGAYEHENDIIRDQILKVSPDYMPFPMPRKDISFPRTGMYG